MALLVGRGRDLSYEEGMSIIHGLEMVPGQMREILAQSEHIRQLAEKYSGAEHFLYIGRKYQYPLALEGALKLKEIAYIHAEGYAAGEMKHGPIALIDPKFPTMALAPEDGSFPMRYPLRALANRYGADDMFSVPPATITSASPHTSPCRPFRTT